MSPRVPSEPFAAALARHTPTASLRIPGARAAAVAIVCRLASRSPEVLLMRRAERPGDSWSGQVCFPGGHADAGDVDLVRTAVRETREEVGLDLDRSSRVLCTLAPVRGMARGRVLPLVITPIVFAEEEAAPMALGPEAAEAFWLPLERVASGELDSRHPYRKGPLRLLLPCWDYEGRVVWGLTYRMIQALLDAGRPRA